MGRVHQVTTSTDQSADDRMYARACYDTLVVMQPHVRTEGLWRVGDDFQIVCPNLETEIADDGRPIADWFEVAMVAGAPVRLASAVPTGGRLVTPRTAEELAQGVGDPLSVRDVFAELVLRLPKVFPDFDISNQSGVRVVTVARDLTPEEKTQLEDALARVGPKPWRLEIDPTVSRRDYRKLAGSGDLKRFSMARDGRPFLSAARRVKRVVHVPSVLARSA